MIYILENTAPIWIKSKPDKTSKSVGVIKPGDLVSSIEIKNDWLKIAKGWVPLYNSEGRTLFISNTKHTEKGNISNNTPLSQRKYYFDNYSPDRDWFPKKSSTWVDNGNKISIINNNDGTWTKIIVISTDKGNEIETHLIDKDGNTIESKHEGIEKNGCRDTIIITKDGKKQEILYDMKLHNRIKTTIFYDENDNVINQNEENLDEDPSYTGEEGLSDDESTEIMASMYESGEGGYHFGKLNINETFGIFGAPYQYMHTVDRPVPSTNVGRLYYDRVITKMPLLFISPGEPKFLAGFGDDERSQLLESMLRSAAADSVLGNFNNRQGRFYVFENKWDIYRQYVYPLTFTAAVYLNLMDEDIPNVGTPAASNWSSWSPIHVMRLFNFMEGVAFYINSDASVSDNFSNGTNKSQLEQKVNQFSDMAKEIQFLLGSTASMAGADVNKFTPMGHGEDASLNIEHAGQFTKDLLGRGNFLEAISTNLLTVVQGGKLIFPEIWGDSSYAKQYNVTIKLRCPDADKLSWYLNIWVPLAHLLPLVLPKAAGANGYLAPFLVRTWYKGMFHCPMGIITDMTVQRGELGDWSLDGLPMSMDINLTIKDLYSVMAIPRRSLSMDLLSIMENIGILDYITNMCGVNINEPDIQRTLKFYYYQKIGGIQNAAEGMLDTLTRTMQNLIGSTMLTLGRRR